MNFGNDLGVLSFSINGHTIRDIDRRMANNREALATKVSKVATKAAEVVAAKGADTVVKVATGLGGVGGAPLKGIQSLNKDEDESVAQMKELQQADPVAYAKEFMEGDESDEM
eukprot:TRINITY_DN58533_c0_g1_i1.p1 TRINITY_DN58533_c0_g1~~TRINITY_DN58533_c0_g1_i1.p1  ORF type:complete len:113 (-),score=31.34 TRINITY_DN58533_c0_g1_i1:80-418(-)